jgi:hypothetical protein
MSVTIYWRPTAKGDKHFRNGTSTSLEKIKLMFGSRLTTNHVLALRAMTEASDDTFYREVADVVEKEGEIEIWGEY